jgi:hypothetical protein
MLRINEITDEPNQRHIVTIEGYENASLFLEFVPSQYSWFFSLVWGDFAIYTQRLTFNHNLLRQWKEILPFGIMVTTTNNLDPVTRDAFAQGVASLYVLTAADIEDMESYLYE